MGIVDQGVGRGTGVGYDLIVVFLLVLLFFVFSCPLSLFLID